MKNFIAIIIICGCVGIAFYTASKFLNVFQADTKECPAVMSKNDLENQQWNKEFTEHEFSELKDSGKSFLTLLVAVFVASITFSEKIVDVKTSTAITKILLISCWIFLLISIGLTGAGIAFLSGAYTEALHYTCSDVSNLWNKSSDFMTYSGLIFGFALTTMLTAGIISFFKT